MFAIGDIVKSNGNDWCTYEIVGLERMKADKVLFSPSRRLDVEVIAVKLKLHDDSKIPRDRHEYPNYTTQVGRVYEDLVDAVQLSKV